MAEVLNPFDYIKKENVNEYTFDELLSIKHDIINHLFDAEQRFAIANHVYDTKYQEALCFTDFDSVLSDNKPTIDMKKAYAKLQGKENKESAIEQECIISNLTHQLDLVNNMIWFKNQQMELMMKIDEQ